ncbi:outer membrane protein assembly factor [Haematobacter massiliensis]|uniref:Membrane protein n=1 Tax=Haematobacter massiliensis TaxID=195105 RepID=A0A086YD42_9RHOB|nr:autotransporter assembly complex family protein [Haematobacter massiliensis]KFI32192.1 membrane protein [Haematobacter massiliensis]OWJ72783.1 outer membrane protein assembly factor [Haematobacter massiliensis]OWJ85826.1 outer membrane protein assembly factor [Haematobacter massiliensis]QBJ24570.1 outer membrane protein assembly factor [Haematobacter massiliensis]
MTRRTDGKWNAALLCATAAICSVSFVPAVLLAQQNQPAEQRQQSRDGIHFNIRGGRDDDLETLLRGASLLSAAAENRQGDPQELIASARADYARLIGALYSRGYYAPVINILVDGREAANIPTLQAPRAIRRIDVNVETGPTFQFGQVSIAPLTPSTTLPSDLRARERARSTLIQQGVDAATTGWRDAGYAKVATGKQDIVADHRQNLLNVDIGMLPGPRVTFGKLIVAGNENVRTERVHAIAGLPEGEVFDPADLEESARRLRRAGAFSSVAIQEADRLGPGNTMDITATVVESLPRRFGFGAEVSSSDGVNLNGYWMHRNLFGGAENLRFDLQGQGLGSGDDQEYSIGALFSRPATFDPDTTLKLGTQLKRTDEQDYTSDSFTITGGVEHYFNEYLTGRIGLEYGFYRIREFGETTNLQILSLPTGATYDRRDDKLNATSGYFLEGEARPFYGINDDAGSGGRVRFDGRAFWSPGESKRVVLAGRVQLGSVLGADITETPREYLFYSGGAGTVRGQPFQSLGVPNPDYLSRDATIGGRNFLGLSGEVRTRVTQSIGVVAFYDAGYVSADKFFDDSGDWQGGIGLGLRYNTGIGPIRLDVGAPLGGDTGNGVQLYVGIGQAF